MISGGWVATAITVAGTAAVSLVGAWFGLPKLRAQAALTLASAEDAVWQRWQKEIQRLEGIIRRQGDELDELRGKLRTAFVTELELLTGIRDRDKRIRELEILIAELPATTAIAGVATIYDQAAAAEAARNQGGGA